MKPRVLISGNKGFIASHLQKALKNRGCHVIGYDKDEKCCFPEVDYVFHYAAMNGTHRFYTEPYDIEMNDTLETLKVINAYAKSDAKIIFASSSELYNDSYKNHLIGLPFDEESPICFNDIKNPRWSYSIPKLVGESLLWNALQQYGTSFTILRYSNIYGPGQKDHFISDFIERALVEEYYIIGNDPRAFMYIDDAVEATINIAFHPQSLSETYNVGNHEISYKPSEIAKIIMGLLGVDERLEILEAEGLKGSSKNRVPDTTKARKLLGTDILLKTDIIDGLEKTLEWHRK